MKQKYQRNKMALAIGTGVLALALSAGAFAQCVPPTPLPTCGPNQSLTSNGTTLSCQKNVVKFTNIPPSTIASGCTDPYAPGPTDSLAYGPMPTSQPSADGDAPYAMPWHVVRFFNTCGLRYCLSIGYSTGWVQEVDGTGATVNCVR